LLFLVIIFACGVGGFLGYKALTNDNQKNIPNEVQKALAGSGQQTEVMKNPNQYRDQAVKDFQGGSQQIDYSSKFEVGKYTQKDNPDLDQNFWNNVYQALIEYDPNLTGNHFKITGLVRLNKKQMDDVIAPEEKGSVDRLYPDFKRGFKVGVYISADKKSKYFVVEERDEISVHRETIF